MLNPDDALERGQFRDDGAQHRATVVGSPRIGITIAGNQDLGTDLLESVDYAERSHIGRRDRPDRTDTRRSQETHNCLRNVAQVADHSVTPGNTQPSKRSGQRSDLSP